ncbi:putative 28S rRNA (cytosine-C(5))-methyltransferase, partial [Phlyctochytrium planicorne]
REVIDIIVDRADIMKGQKKVSIDCWFEPADIPKTYRGVAIFLVYDLIFGKGLGEAGQFKQWIMQNKARLNAELAKIKINRKIKDNADLIPAHIRNAVVLPRYVRVNTLITTVSNVLEALKKDGYSQLDPSDRSVLLKYSSLHPLHDKASCFPAFILNPPKNSKIIDACAAPGNKTSHLAAIMENTGSIIAFDLDPVRLKTLVKLTTLAHCKNITAINKSFLEVEPNSKEYRDVEYILLDPSCSGSGIVRRLDHLLAGGDEDEENVETNAIRIHSLADFQVSVLKHAFKFPKVKKVVYSTCSKHVEENEGVVSRVLDGQIEFRLSTNVFPDENLVRTIPEEDHVIGFFVALFERVSLTIDQTSVIGREPDIIDEEEGDGDTAPATLSSKKRKRNSQNKGKKKRKVIGLAIGQELDLQNEMLEDLDNSVTKVGDNLKSSSKKLDTVMGKKK